MNLREFREKAIGGDDLEVILVIDGDAYEVHGCEEGEGASGRQELWIVAGDPSD